jgi:hypothetical protein
MRAAFTGVTDYTEDWSDAVTAFAHSA